MPLSQILFSFDGRITREVFWTVWLPVVIVAVILRITLNFLIYWGSRGEDVSGWWFVLMAGTILCTWINFAVVIKRCHDRGKSGTWSLLCLIPLVGLIWTIAECGSCVGTDGPNQYGPDPRAPNSPAPTSGTANQSEPVQASTAPASASRNASESLPQQIFREPEPAPFGATALRKASRPFQRPSGQSAVLTSQPQLIDQNLLVYSREHKEKLRLEAEFEAFGEVRLAAFRERAHRLSLEEAFRSVTSEIRSAYRLANDSEFERTRRAFQNLKSISTAAHAEIVAAYEALKLDSTGMRRRSASRAITPPR